MATLQQRPSTEWFASCHFPVPIIIPGLDTAIVLPTDDSTADTGAAATGSGDASAPSSSSPIESNVATEDWLVPTVTQDGLVQLDFMCGRYASHWHTAMTSPTPRSHWHLANKGLLSCWAVCVTQEPY